MYLLFAKWGSILAVLVAMVLYGMGLQAKIELQKAEMAGLRNSLLACEASTDTLTIALNSSNAQIEANRADVKKMEAQRDTLAERLQNSRKEAKAEVDAILKQPKPVDCTASMMHLRRKAREISEWR